MKVPFLIVTSLILTVSLGYSQPDIKKIVPLSPTAAEISKYGEIPVGLYTGVPDISIPIHQIQTANFNMPISLSYHAGGNKVESIASRVGLGWSIVSIPIISRSVNGKADETDGGIFYKYNGKTIKQLADESNNGQLSDYGNLLRGVKLGTLDSEPDIFSYSINGKSGKFYFDQVQQKFVTLPKENVVINWYFNYFTIVADNGDKYYFTEKETSQRNTSSPGEKTVTSWCVSKIVNANHTDSLIFSYSPENQLSYNYTSFNKYQWFSGNLGGCAIDAGPDNPNTPENQQSMTASTFSETLNLLAISFNGGHLQFNNGARRLDLNGGTVLDNIELYGNSNQLIKKYRFKYFYKAASSNYNCVANDSYSLNWLFLKELQQLSIADTSHIDHKFEYDETYAPCRGSTAQDYWGYYNGKSSNQTLVPTQVVNLYGPSVQILGADRSVDPSYSKFGVIRKIIYPTGGHTEFDFENNEVNSSDVPKNYVTQMQSLSGEGTPTTNTYEATFTINNPRDKQLNNDNVNGGAFIDVDFGGLGCDFSNGATPCAYIALQRLNDMQFIYQNIAYPFKSFYVSNGTYKMIISFNQNFNPPPDYNSFYYMVKWNKIDSTITQSYAGGLRVNEIRNYLGSSNSLASTKRFKYTVGLNSNISSGDVLSVMHPGTYVDIVQYISLCYVGGAAVPQLDNAFYLRLKAFSNVQQITHSGSYVGYKKVIVLTSDPTQTGYTINTYDHVRDIVDPYVPYPPPQSSEVFRGNLLSENHYKLMGSKLYPVSKTENTYSPNYLDVSVVYGIKAADNISSNYPEFAAVPPVKLYELLTEWNRLSQKKETVYDPSDTTKFTQTVSNFQYDPDYNLLSTTQTLTSRGETLTSNLKYTKDSATVAPYTQMLQRNVIVPVLNEAQSRNNAPVHTKRIMYSTYPNSNAILPKAMQERVGVSPFETQLIYKNYDEKGNLETAGKPGGAETSFLWGYGGLYPIAQCLNANKSEFYYDGFEQSNNASSFTAHTGSKYTTSASVNFLRPNSRSYVISYWYRINGTWKYSNEIPYIANTYSLSGGDAYDDIRIYPKDAQITTYTYAPLVGMTSQTDARGNTTYYEYDSFQRLHLIRDAKGNIAKKICYNYAGQAGGCPVSVPATTPTTPPVQTVYARVEIDSLNSFINANIQGYMADVYIRFYSDANCLSPLALSSNLSVMLNDHFTAQYGGQSDDFNYTYPYVVNGGSNNIYIGNMYVRNKLLYADPVQGEDYNDLHVFTLLPVSGSNYVIKPTYGDTYIYN